MNIPLLFQNHKNIDDLNEKEIIKCIQILKAPSAKAEGFST